MLPFNHFITKNYLCYDLIILHIDLRSAQNCLWVVVDQHCPSSDSEVGLNTKEGAEAAAWFCFSLCWPMGTTWHSHASVPLLLPSLGLPPKTQATESRGIKRQCAFH